MSIISRDMGLPCFLHVGIAYSFEALKGTVFTFFKVYNFCNTLASLFHPGKTS